MSGSKAAVIHQHAELFVRHKHADVFGLRELTQSRRTLVRIDRGAWLAVIAGFLLGALASWLLLDVAGYVLWIIPFLTSYNLMSAGLWVGLIAVFSLVAYATVRLLRNIAF
jgi:hypothetical protein